MPEVASRLLSAWKSAAQVIIAFVATVILGWPTADHGFDARLGLVAAALLGHMSGPRLSGRLLVGASWLGLLCSYVFFSPVESSGFIAVLGSVAVLEAIGLTMVLHRTMPSLSDHTPIRRFLKFATWVGLFALSAGLLEGLVVNLFDPQVSQSIITKILGIATAGCVASIVVVWKASHWFRYGRSTLYEILPPMIVVIITLMGIAVTKFVWQGQAGNKLISVTFVLGVEIVLGIFVLGIFLYGVNAQFIMSREGYRRESLLEAILDATPGMAIVFDHQFKVVLANHEVRHRFEKSVRGIPVTSLFGLEDDSGRQRLVLDLLQCAIDGQSARTELSEEGSNNAMRIFELEASPIASIGSDSVGFLHSVDATQRRSHAMRSSQSERMESLGALAGGLAHDFNNLLFVTLGNLQLLAMDETIAQDEKLSKFLSRSMSAVERGAEITKSLLAVARSQPLEERAVTLADLIKGLLPLVRQALGDGRRVEVALSDPNVQLMVDAGRLSSCILNIAFNSRDAMGPTGTLHIAASQVSDTNNLELSITDDGKGMAPDVVERAFEPFFTTKKAGSGTGLGLATVYAFAKQSGGSAYLESRLGFGTTVTLVLPIHDGATKVNSAVTQRRAGRRVVVADDEQALAELVTSWLIDLGVDARLATSPKAALELIESFEPDVLISDANFGEEMDGIGLARLGAAIVPDLAVIFMTGFSHSMRDLQELGEITLAKPFSRQDLYSALLPFIADIDLQSQGPRDTREVGEKNDDSEAQI